MAPGIWFWIIYVMVALGLFGLGYRDERWHGYMGPGVILFILLGLVGWGAFGPPIH